MPAGSGSRSISIVVPTVHAGDLLAGCLEAVGEPAGLLAEVIVVLNGSPAGSADEVERRFPWARVLDLEANAGFAGGANRGTEAARSDRVLILNDDARPRAGWLEPLAAALDEPAEGGVPTAVVTPLVVTDGVPPEAYARNGTLSLAGRNAGSAFDDRTRVFYASGCAILVRRDLVGLPFDESYFAYSEDVFLGWRARIQGLGVRMVPESVVDHLGGATASPGVRRTYWQERNRLRTVLACHERGTLVKAAPLLAVDLIAAFLGKAIRFRGSALGVIGGAAWVFAHPKRIARARSAVQRLRAVPDRDIVPLMSCRTGAGDGWGAPPAGGARAALDRALAAYCRLVRLPVLETRPGRPVAAPPPEPAPEPALPAPEPVAPVAAPADDPDPSAAPTLSVVIVSYRSRPALDDCLASVSVATSGTDVDVVVVDNASGDGTADWIRREHPWARLVESAENGGFGAAANLGLEASAGGWVLLLNPDAQITREAIDELRQAAARYPSFPVMAPRLIDASGRVEASAHPYPSLGAYFRKVLSRSEAWDSSVPPDGRAGGDGDSGGPGDPVPVDWATGACLLLRKDVIREAGGFDDGYFLYFEEVDLQRRLAALGHRTRYLPWITVTHAGRGGAARYSGPRISAYHQALYRYFSIHHGAGAGLALRPLVVVRSATRLAYWGLRSLGGPDRPASRERAAAYGKVLARSLGPGEWR